MNQEKTFKQKHPLAAAMIAVICLLIIFFALGYGFGISVQSKADNKYYDDFMNTHVCMKKDVSNLKTTNPMLFNYTS